MLLDYNERLIAPVSTEPRGPKGRPSTEPVTVEAVDVVDLVTRKPEHEGLPCSEDSLEPEASQMPYWLRSRV